MRKLNLTVLIISILLTTIVISCKEKKENSQPKAMNPANQPALSVEATIAQISSLSANVEVPGSILANESTEIHPEVSGRVVQLNVREGAFVNQGTLLAKLYDGDLQAQLRKLQVQLQIAEQTEKRQAELLKIQGISQQDYDLSLLQVHNLKADMDIVKEGIRKTEIRAPFNGKLGLKNISPGAFITPTTIITTISQVSQLKLQFNVPEKYSSQLRNGQPVNFTIDGTNKSFTANIIATEANVEENTRTLAARALVRNSDPALIPGAFAKVKIILGKAEDAIMVPNLVIIPQGRTKQIYIYTGGKAQPTEVTTGVRDSSNIQVLTGLKVGDTVITSGLLFLRPGADIKISKIN